MEALCRGGTAGFRHQQLIHLFGAVLRTLSCLFSARYLSAEGVESGIDGCIAGNLRRPEVRSRHLDAAPALEAAF